MDHLQRLRIHVNQHPKNQWRTTLKPPRGSVIWQNRCKKIDQLVICVEINLENFVNKMPLLSSTFLWHRGSPYIQKQTSSFSNKEEPLNELWRLMEDSFIKTRNITYDCFVFFSFKQQKMESVQSFYGRLIGQA